MLLSPWESSILVPAIFGKVAWAILPTLVRALGLLAFMLLVRSVFPGWARGFPAVGAWLIPSTRNPIGFWFPGGGNGTLGGLVYRVDRLSGGDTGVASHKVIYGRFVGVVGP